MTLLLFPATGRGDAHWLRLGENNRVERGAGLAAAPIVTPGERVVLVVPGEDVAMHWIELPRLAPNQARAAARLAAAEVVAQPLDQLHVAIGTGADGDARPMAIVEAATMAGWLAQVQAHALDPDMVVPEPLLLLPPAEGERHWRRNDGTIVARGIAAAHVLEPALAELIAEAPVETVDAARFDAEIGAALDAVSLDLRQGAFAKRRRWRFDAALARRLAVTGALILLALVATQVVLIARYRLEANRADARATALAAQVLPRATRIVDAGAQLDARLGELHGGGLGFSATAGLLFDAVRAAPGLELTALSFDAGGRASATIAATGPSDVQALAASLERAGLTVSTGASRAEAGRQVADLTVSVR